MGAEKLLNQLEKEINKEIETDKIYIFGSLAKGDYHKDSDADIAVISNEFKGMRPRERYEKIINQVRKATKDRPVDLLCYTPEEFEKNQDSILPQIISEEGIST
jgi:hypothetical protein